MDPEASLDSVGMGIYKNLCCYKEKTNNQMIPLGGKNVSFLLRRNFRQGVLQSALLVGVMGTFQTSC